MDKTMFMQLDGLMPAKMPWGPPEVSISMRYIIINYVFMNMVIQKKADNKLLITAYSICLFVPISSSTFVVTSVFGLLLSTTLAADQQSYNELELCF